MGNLLYAAVSDCTLVGQLDAEFTYRERFFRVLQEMLNNCLKRMGNPCFSIGSLCFDMKVSVEIIFAGSPCSYFQETLTFVDFYIVMRSQQLKLQEAVSVLSDW